VAPHTKARKQAAASSPHSAAAASDAGSGSAIVVSDSFAVSSPAPDLAALVIRDLEGMSADTQRSIAFLPLKELAAMINLRLPLMLGLPAGEAVPARLVLNRHRAADRIALKAIVAWLEGHAGRPPNLH
jgi:hypothetical protein